MPRALRAKDALSLRWNFLQPPLFATGLPEKEAITKPFVIGLKDFSTQAISRFQRCLPWWRRFPGRWPRL